MGFPPNSLIYESKSHLDRPSWYTAQKIRKALHAVALTSPGFQALLAVTIVQEVSLEAQVLVVITVSLGYISRARGREREE